MVTNNSTSSNIFDCLGRNCTNVVTDNDSTNDNDKEETAMFPTIFLFCGVAAMFVLPTLICLIQRHRRRIRTQHTNNETTTRRQVMEEVQDPQAEEAAKRRRSSLRLSITSSIFTEQPISRSSLFTEEQPISNTSSDLEGGSADLIAKQEQQQQEETCAICFEPYGEFATSTACSHVFHRECILDWSQIQSECPICRQTMWDPKIYNELLKKEKEKPEEAS